MLSEEDKKMQEEYLDVFKEHLPETCPLPVKTFEDGTNVLVNGDAGLYLWIGQHCNRIEKHMSSELSSWIHKQSRKEMEWLAGDIEIDHKLLTDVQTDIMAEKYNLEW